MTDQGVNHMAPLMALRHLSLAQNVRITDASLLVLSALTGLTFLNLKQSKLTGNGIQHLQNLTVRALAYMDMCMPSALFKVDVVVL